MKLLSSFLGPNQWPPDPAETGDTAPLAPSTSEVMPAPEPLPLRTRASQLPVSSDLGKYFKSQMSFPCLSNKLNLIYVYL